MLKCFTDREFNHVLAALRTFQALPVVPEDIERIATDGEVAERLMTPEEIDELCERLNMDTDLDLEAHVVVELEDGIPQNVFLFSDGKNAEEKAKALVQAESYRNENDCVQVFKVGPDTDEGGDAQLSNGMIDEWLEQADKVRDERAEKKIKPRKR